MNSITLANRTSLLALATSMIVACGVSGDAGEDTSAAATARTASASAGGAAGDSMAGMDHSNMPGMNMPPARDADQELLRMLVDHHEGMIQMMDPAMEKATSATAKADAKRVHDAQHEEQERLVAMLQRSYDETKQPMVMSSDSSMVADLQNSAASAGYDRKMYQHTIMHHQQGIRMISDYLPRLASPELRQMVERMRAVQQREIEEFQRKAST